MIRRTLAPGVYLLSCSERSEAAGILRKAGVEIIAMPPSASNNARGRSFRNYFPGMKTLHSLSLGAENDAKNAIASSGEKAESIKENFRKSLEKMKLSKPEKDELLARIERRLILTETQLEGTFLRYEKLEARGLDYAGKTVIAKQAHDSGSLIEVSWPVSGEGTSRVVGTVHAIEKKGGDTVLVVKPRISANSAGGNNTHQETIRIPLGKISLLRRIKQSIFGE
jgi:hypothetical protein